MSVPHLTVLNAAKFPIVTLDSSELISHGIEAMIADFEALLVNGTAFALYMGSRHRGPEQSHDDQKRWILWLKENHDRMAVTCRGMVSVIDTAIAPDLQLKQAAGMEVMIGIPVRLANNSDEAERIAIDLLD